jgi:hypothetical protein
MNSHNGYSKWNHASSVKEFVFSLSLLFSVPRTIDSIQYASLDQVAITHGTLEDFVDANSIFV